MKKLSTITQFIAKVKGKKGGVRLGREGERQEGGRQGRGRERSREIKGEPSHFPNHSGQCLYVSIHDFEEITADIQGPNGHGVQS
jgi:hypothetical protein